MVLPKKAIEEFKVMYKRVVKQDISDEKAEREAQALMKLMILAFETAKKRKLAEVNKEIL